MSTLDNVHITLPEAYAGPLRCYRCGSKHADTLEIAVQLLPPVSIGGHTVEVTISLTGEYRTYQRGCLGAGVGGWSALNGLTATAAVQE